MYNSLACCTILYRFIHYTISLHVQYSTMSCHIQYHALLHNIIKCHNISDNVEYEPNLVKQVQSKLNQIGTKKCPYPKNQGTKTKPGTEIGSSGLYSWFDQEFLVKPRISWLQQELPGLKITFLAKKVICFW